jgi:hypothetical protein
MDLKARLLGYEGPALQIAELLVAAQEEGLLVDPASHHVVRDLCEDGAGRASHGSVWRR